MKPVLILQHLGADGPAFLATWLRRRGRPFELRNNEAGQEFPESPGAYGAIALLGGEMSANDDLPALRRAEALIRAALAAGLPVIGHCLGGQLIARALGARIGASPAPEVGWLPIEVADSAPARAWFGSAPRPCVFQWHYEAFDLPPGAELPAASPACPHQAFAVGSGLALQFHLEADAEKLGRWSGDRTPRDLDALGRYPSVQSAGAMCAGTAAHLEAQTALAERIYGRWLQAAA
ncbi:MAG: type 1 glutamine amidotransferase [Burkholderiales bacterium]|nr:type 1 glutamine amidotransferase [Burkholderiales bacterium]MDE2398063.1 type 1 glutamine amidotransferase [Burkholderiales bacterium]